MATLWSKGTKATDIVEEFTVGNDRSLDMRLAKYDVTGSKAHIKMLESIGLKKTNLTSLQKPSTPSSKKSKQETSSSKTT